MNKSFRVRVGSGAKSVTVWTYAENPEEIIAYISARKTVYSVRQTAGKSTPPRKAKKASKPAAEGQVTEDSGKAESTQ